tara:strand:- start:4938 stop:5636 length:699 start_codon:yes stop_codon:yes gene_type:complete
MSAIAEFQPERIKVLVFDVDDTVTRGTLGIKIETWKRLFADQLDRLQEARELYEFTGLGDRYNIIAHVIEEPQEDCRDNKRVEEFAERFDEMTQEAIREHGIHEEDLAALINIRNSFSGQVYLLSATPEESVVANIRHFESEYPELAGMFTKIIGYPMTNGKAGELTLIAEENQVNADEIVMIGDGGSDYNGAKGAGTQMIGIITEKNRESWAEERFPSVDSVADIPALLNL